MTGILLGIVIALIIISALFLVVLLIRQPQANRVKMDKFSVEMLTYSPVFKGIIDKIVPPQEEIEYRKAERLISDSGYDISMRTLYLFKFVIPIIIFISCISIYFINKSVVVNAIVTDQFIKTVDVLGGKSNDDLTNEEKRDRERAAKDTYEIVDNLLDTRFLKSAEAIDVKNSIQKILLNNNLATDDNVYYKTNEMYEKMINVQEAKKVEPVTIVFILIISLAGFIVPNVFLSIGRMIRYQSFDNEVIALEMLTILVGSIENVTVKEILRILALNSKAYKKNFEKALLEYPIDFEQALVNLSESSKNKDFQALISTLRQCATSDKYAALQTLQRRRISRKEYRKLIEEKKIETKMYIGFIMLLPVLFFLAKLLLSPWQDLMSSSGLL